MMEIMLLLGLLMVARKDASDEGQTSLDSENENLFENLQMELGGGIGLNWAKVGQELVIDAVMIMTKGTAVMLGYAIPDWAKETGFGKTSKPNPKWSEERCAILNILGEEMHTLVCQTSLIRACVGLVVENNDLVSTIDEIDGVTKCIFNTGVKATISKVEVNNKSRLIFE